MQVTLRKASKLSAGLLALINSISLKQQIKISIYTPAGSVSTLIDKAQEDLQKKSDELANLVVAYSSIRTSIGTANSKSGISDLLSQDASLNLLQTKLKSVSTQVDEVPLVTIESKIARLAGQENIYIEDVDITVPNPFVVDRLKQIKKDRAEIADQLLVLNTGTKIELSDFVKEVIEQYDL